MQMSLDEIPGSWTAGLVRLRNKKPIDAGWNRDAESRWLSGAGDWREAIEEHLAHGGDVGMVPPPGVVCIDCDNVEAVQWVERLKDPETPWMVRTERSAHAWLSYTLPPNVGGWLSKGLTLPNGAKLDLRVEGKSQGVVPPSQHASGTHYAWVTPFPERVSDVPEMPADMMAALIEAGGVRARAVNPPSGENAHDTVRDWIFSRVDTCETVEELHTLAKQFAEYYVAPARPGRYQQMTSSRELHDLVTGAWDRRGRDDLPRILRAGIGDDRYVYFWRRHFEEQWLHVGEWSPQGVWVRWDEESWKHQPQMGEEGFHGALRRFSVQLKHLRDHDDPRAEDHTSYCQMIDTLRGELARSKSAASPVRRLTEALSERGERFDVNPHLWGCPQTEDVPARTIDFKDQRIYKPEPEDRITQLAGAPYIPGKRSEIWERFVSEAFPDIHVRRFVQACVGYTLLGDPCEDIVLFLIGRGGSGKSTFIGTLEKVFGQYAGTVPAVEIDDKLPGAGAGGTNASLLALRGKRIATCTELSDRVRLGAKLKALSGGDMQSGRGLYARTVTSFQPRFVIWLGGNFQPEAKAVDTGLTRRMRYIPMEVRPQKVDPQLKEKLRQPMELAGVMNWAIEGLRMYLSDGGIITPAAVEARSLRARIEASDIGPWMHDRVVKDEGADGFSPSEGYDAFVEWFMETHSGGRRGLPVKTVARFGEEMAALGHSSRRVRTNGKVRRLFVGLRILTPRERAQRDDERE